MHPVVGLVLLIGLANHARSAICLTPLTVDESLRRIWTNSDETTGIPLAVYIDPCNTTYNMIHVQYVAWHTRPGYSVINFMVHVTAQDEGYRLTEQYQLLENAPLGLLSLSAEYYDNLPVFNSNMGTQCPDYSSLDTVVVNTCVPGLWHILVWDPDQVAAQIYNTDGKLNIPLNPTVDCTDMVARYEPCPVPFPPVAATSNLCTLGIFSTRKLEIAFFYNVWVEIKKQFADDQNAIPLQVTMGNCTQHTAHMLWLIWLTDKAPLIYSGTVDLVNPANSALLYYKSNTWRETPTVTTIDTAMLLPPEGMMRSAVTECIDYQAIPAAPSQQCLVDDTIQQYPQRDLVYQQIFSSQTRLAIPVNVPELNCAQGLVQVSRCTRTRANTVAEQQHPRVEARNALYSTLHTLLPMPLKTHKNAITRIDERAMDPAEDELLLHITYYELDFDTQTNSTPSYYDVRAVYEEDALSYTIESCNDTSHIDINTMGTLTLAYDCITEPICFYRTAKWYHQVVAPAINNGTPCPSFYSNTQCNPVERWWIILVYYVYPPCVALVAIAVVIKNHHRFILEK